MEGCVIELEDGKNGTAPGFEAVEGWDVASGEILVGLFFIVFAPLTECLWVYAGWGTPNVAKLLRMTAELP